MAFAFSARKDIGYFFTTQSNQKGHKDAVNLLTSI